jgi:hypothetical protein
MSGSKAVSQHTNDHIYQANPENMLNSFVGENFTSAQVISRDYVSLKLESNSDSPIIHTIKESWRWILNCFLRGLYTMKFFVMHLLSLFSGKDFGTFSSQTSTIKQQLAIFITYINFFLNIFLQYFCPRRAESQFALFFMHYSELL